MSFLLAVVATLSVQADSVTVQPKFRDGTLSACEIVFDNYLIDRNYLNGAAVHVAGSWAFTHFADNNSVYGMLKVGVTPDGREGIGPTDAYIINGYDTNKADQMIAVDGEMPGFRLFGFNFTGEQTMMALMGPSVEGRFTVGYILGDGRSPQTFDVVMNDEQTQQYADCVAALIPTVERALEAQEN